MLFLRTQVISGLLVYGEQGYRTPFMDLQALCELAQMTKDKL